MSHRYHFISGLPRSGSTLLGAVLRQNPRFQAGMTSPVALLAFSLLPEMSPPGQFAACFDDARRRAMLRGLFDSYYGAERRDVVFDTNRVWCGNVALLADLFPDSKIICCVREVGWVIDSVERMLRRNPLLASRIFEGRTGQTIYGRTESLMNAEVGLIGAAWSNLREAWFGDLADRLLIMSYEGLVADPAASIGRLYQALGEPPFAHDFEHVVYEAGGYDADLATPGLHTVRQAIAAMARTPAIPPDIFNKYAANAFWRAPSTRPNSPVLIC